MQYFLLLILLSVGIKALDLDSHSNVVLFWGQSSAGKHYRQPRLRTYCKDDTNDAIVLMHLADFTDPQKYGTLRVNKFCHDIYCNKDNSYGNMETLEEDIKFCQSQGKPVFLSLIQPEVPKAMTPDEMKSVAVKLCDSFLVKPCPLGDFAFDGFTVNFNLTSIAVKERDIFIEKLQENMSKHPTKETDFDFVLPYFSYNESCSIGSDGFNLEEWVNKLADKESKLSKNKDIKVFATFDAMPATLKDTVNFNTISDKLSSSYNKKSFAGVAIWDASRSDINLDENEKTFARRLKSTLRGLEA
ncbi:glycoside hydrolase family 18 protein [Tortispora caseinolytica NRRL Y-17796]|uniref:Glycoside hydrolase family 18 protein n=1 Tax=Tortispora caseinolytica NRRL Y-17796 TaxID=767744 RepID=A0A1E4TJ30_9ASCO|nr:glycoside hydrolase family 18 protein [Tortispora caseinolytica NRRL Y-17796]